MVGVVVRDHDPAHPRPAELGQRLLPRRTVPASPSPASTIVHPASSADRVAVDVVERPRERHRHPCHPASEVGQLRVHRGSMPPRHGGRRTRPEPRALERAGCDARQRRRLRRRCLPRRAGHPARPRGRAGRRRGRARPAAPPVPLRHGHDQLGAPRRARHRRRLLARRGRAGPLACRADRRRGDVRRGRHAGVARQPCGPLRPGRRHLRGALLDRRPGCVDGRRGGCAPPGRPADPDRLPPAVRDDGQAGAARAGVRLRRRRSPSGSSPPAPTPTPTWPPRPT